MKQSRLFLLPLLFFTACAPSLQGEITRTDLVLGTVCTVRIIEGGTSKTTDEIFVRLRKIEDEMSANKSGTEIAAINDAAGVRAVAVSDSTFSVVARALEYARLSGGAFDPTIGPLVKLWSIGNDDARIPAPEEISAVRALIDYRKVELDTKKKSVFLAEKGMLLDLGAIAKGYAADEAARILERHKVRSAVVDLGGNILVYGKKKDGSPWRVGIQDPASDRGEYIGLVTGPAMTVVTSGIYERFFIEGGIRYHHLLDRNTGAPARNTLVSVSIIARKSIDADALSTSAFVLGLEEGMKLIEGMQEVSAIFIDKDNRIYLSSGAKKIFTLTSDVYRLGN